METSAQRQQYSIGELAKRTGVGVPAIRYYEEIGLLPVAGRGPGGHRIFDEAHLKQLVFIRRSRQLGFSQDDVRALLTSADQREASCADVDRLTKARLETVRQKIADLQALERALESMVAACQGVMVDECSIIDALSGG